MKKISVLILLSLILNTQPANAVDVLPQPFFDYLGSKYLAKPGIILLDGASKEVVYESGSTILRSPASVLKLTSATAVAMTLDSTTVFTTSLYKTEKRGVFVILGENDPWMTSSAKYRDANKRAYTPTLIKKAFASDKKLKKITLLYRGVSGTELYKAKRALGRRASVVYKALDKNIDPKSLITEKVVEIKSPQLLKMIKFALLYSDNLLSQRLVMLATTKSGYAADKNGLNEMMNEKLTALGVDTTGLHLEDGSGLSGGNRISAVTVSQLLLKIRSEPKLKVVYDSLPTSGQSGTLIGRYHSTAPQAVGLVKAKTGSTRNTVSLAGFATSGEKEYIFVVIADHVGRTKRMQNAARSAIDRMLGTITKPSVTGLTTIVAESATATVIN
ncbi:MAG: D-alanyl-D-alanine carboxypeptidase [Candidatus Nanopelagicus sp.]|jgi:D-alanyl-D-alanine carboxypeptidase|nr:D-alanyl-D-alanine carboxypeptidase [Candidatus Nanopelagicus sp.]